MSSDRTAVGTVLQFLCGGSHWYLMGSPVIKCLPDGYWNDSAPHCVEGRKSGGKLHELKDLYRGEHGV